MSLMDIINKRKQSFGSAPVSSETLANQQSQLTGKEPMAQQAAPEMSNIQARLAAQTGQNQMAQQQLEQQTQLSGLAQQEQIQKQQFEMQTQAQQQSALAQTQDIMAKQTMSDLSRQQEEDIAIKNITNQEQMRLKEMNTVYADSLSRLASERGIAEQELFQYAKQKKSELNLAEHVSFLEQTAHMMALSDKKYVDTLDMIGRTNRLNDEIEFKKESQRIAFGNDFDILIQKFGQEALLNEDMRSYRKAIAELDIQTALSMAEIAYKEKQYKQIIQGVTNTTTGIVDWYNQPDKSGSDTLNTGYAPGQGPVGNTEQFGGSR